MCVVYLKYFHYNRDTENEIEFCGGIDIERIVNIIANDGGYMHEGLLNITFDDGTESSFDELLIKSDEYYKIPENCIIYETAKDLIDGRYNMIRDFNKEQDKIMKDRYEKAIDEIVKHQPKEDKIKWLRNTWKAINQKPDGTWEWDKEKLHKITTMALYHDVVFTIRDKCIE